MTPRSCGLTLLLFSAAVSAMTPGDFDELVGHFAGDYSNYMQFEDDREVQAAHPHALLHSIFFGPVPVDPAVFGARVFYVQQFSDGNASAVYRQQLYSFNYNAADGLAQLDYFMFKDPARFLNAQLDPSKLTGLTANDTVAVTQNCSLVIERTGAIFSGHTHSDMCVIPDPSTGRAVRIVDDNLFGPDFVTTHERWYDAATGKQVFGNPTPDVLNRSFAPRLFTGYVALEVAPNQYLALRNVSLWDAGQALPLYFNATFSGYTLELAQAIYDLPAGGTDAVLKVAVHHANYTHDGRVLALAYAWTAPTAAHLGVNLRSIQAGLQLADDPSLK